MSLKVIFSLDPLYVSMTGIGRYTYELSKGLRDSNVLDQLRFQFLLGWCDDPEHLIERFHRQGNTSAAKGNSGVKGAIYKAARSIYWKSSPLLQGLMAAKYKDYIYHAPSFVLPHFPGKCVSTVHDMSAFRVPHFHPASRVKNQQSFFPHLVKKSSLFITVSEFSKRELIELFPSVEGRVVSIPLGVDPVFKPRTSQDISGVLSKYGLAYAAYTLSVGTIEPRKNIEALIDAYATLPGSIKNERPLVLVGGQGWNSEATHLKIAKYEGEGWLRYLRYVTHSDLPALYSGAQVSACVSHYEGFGLPVLESMASGVAVLSSNAASLPEVGGNAVVYVQPDNLESIRDGLIQLITDEARCDQLAASGLERSKSFNWDRTVQETIAAYRLIA